MHLLHKTLVQGVGIVYVRVDQGLVALVDHTGGSEGRVFEILPVDREDLVPFVQHICIYHVPRGIDARLPCLYRAVSFVLVLARFGTWLNTNTLDRGIRDSLGEGACLTPWWLLAQHPDIT